MKFRKKPTFVIALSRGLSFWTGLKGTSEPSPAFPTTSLCFLSVAVLGAAAPALAAETSPPGWTACSNCEL